MPIKTVKFILQTTTKGAARYQEVNDSGVAKTMKDADCIVGTLYLRKSGLNGNIPNNLEIDVKY